MKLRVRKMVREVDISELIKAKDKYYQELVDTYGAEEAIDAGKDPTRREATRRLWWLRWRMGYYNMTKVVRVPKWVEVDPETWGEEKMAAVREITERMRRMRGRR